MSPEEKDKIDCEYLAYFMPMPILFSADATIFLIKQQQQKKYPWKHEKTALKSCS